MINKKSIFLIMLVIVLFVACGSKEKDYTSMDSKVESGENDKISSEDVSSNSDKSSGEDKTRDENQSNDKDSTIEDGILSDYDRNHFVKNIKSVVTNQEDLLPDTEYIVQSQNVFLCHYVDSDMFHEYQDMLVERGFTLYNEENIEDQIYYQYYGDVIGIEIVQLSEVTIVSIAPNNQGITDCGLPKEDVLSMIQKEENENWSRLEITKDTVRRKPGIIFKHWIYELYEKTQMEAYVTFTSEGKESGIYLIHGERAYEIKDPLDNICIADIDQNGTYELLSLYGFGFGVYRIHLNVYQYGRPRTSSSFAEIVHQNYYNCYVPMKGYSQLKFHKIDDTTIHLIEDEEDGKNYGKLMIEKDGIHVNPEFMAEFPYYQWDIDYKSSNISSNPYTPTDHQEIPELTVKIGDTIIENRSRKIDWHGEEENKVTFSSLMEDEIPMFSIASDEEDIHELCLSFSEIRPTSVKVVDYLITENGGALYNKAGMVERDVRYGRDGYYYIPLTVHWASMLSSSTVTYTNPSYRGYRVTCEFGDNQTCEYTFVLSTEPSWTIIDNPIQSSID